MQSGDIRYGSLPDPLRPLLDKFYRSQRSQMRAERQGQAWVARRGEVIAAMSLTPVAHGHWLTGLFVTPAERGQAIASNLLRCALGQSPGPFWLFCHPQLVPFYRGLGFNPCDSLPETLADRLSRYQRSKSLLALEHGNGTGPL